MPKTKPDEFNLNVQWKDIFNSIFDAFWNNPNNYWWREHKEIVDAWDNLKKEVLAMAEDNRMTVIEILRCYQLGYQFSLFLKKFEPEPEPEPEPPDILKDKIAFGVEDIKYLEAIKDCGFNTVLIYTILFWNSERVKSFLDRCKELELKCMPSFHTCYSTHELPESKVVEFIRQWKSHPAIYSWYTFDEPIVREIAVESQIVTYDLVKNLDPEHPVSICICARNDPHYYDEHFTSESYDLLLANCYPICKWNIFDHDYEGLRKYFGKAVENVKRLEFNAIPVLQAHYDGDALQDPLGTIANQYRVWKDGGIKGNVAMFAWRWSGGPGLYDDEGLREEVKNFLI